jgi:hypothetical protein
MKTIPITFMLLLLTCIVSSSTAKIKPSELKTEKWYQPSCMRVQYAGQIGFLSAGFGKIYLNETLETDLMFGYVPETIGGDHINILTLKQSFSPFAKSTKIDRLTILPITIGFNFSYHFGEEYNKYDTDKYPDDYYWFMNGIRIGAFIGSDFNLKLKPDVSKVFSSISFYYDIGTTDLEACSMTKNPGQYEICDIVNVAFGTKLFFYK